MEEQRVIVTSEFGGVDYFYDEGFGRHPSGKPLSFYEAMYGPSAPLTRAQRRKLAVRR